MKTPDFNEEAKLPRYSYAPSPVHERGYLILRREAAEDEPVPVGDYTVLDRQEERDLSEKKIMNVVSALNGKNELVQLGEQTGSRLLFHMMNDGTNGEKVKVMFYEYKAEGVSIENALLQMEDDHVWH